MPDPAGADASDRPSVTAVVPARNEAARIGATVEELRRHVDEIVVVDDASDDETAALAAAAGAVVICNEARLGYIGAVRRGFAAASGEVVVTVDADGEMPVERIAELVAPIAAGLADMVQGHRSHVPRVSERLVTAIAGLGAGVGDSGTGFRAMRTGLARDLEIRGSCICGSMTLEARARGARLAEIPVVARQVPGRGRRIAWNHLGQALLVARLALALRLGRRPAQRGR
ncbi:MAG TPA: glycosyltransferase family 2 protein [Candidatus Limnocylindrales bacterium]|nr:glycosyltransferase family 2 protein [Candidatus Limnocylindrales bacterium]